ncbi:DNA repair protein RadC [Tistrella mobilis]|uniref:RadC family protein n=1 Tax=Tistrella mobilis TaxID=171437 RepID=UPI003557EA76
MTDRRRPDPNQTAAAPVTGFARAADMIARAVARPAEEAPEAASAAPQPPVLDVESMPWWQEAGPVRRSAPGLDEASGRVVRPAPENAPESGTAKPHYHGHRQRLRDRLLERGADALADYELLELLIAAAIPRGDVKPIAKRLLQTFGSLGDVLHAEPARLKAVEGVGPAVLAQIKLAEGLKIRSMREEVIDRPLFASWQALMDYLMADLGHLRVEQFRVLFLDRKNRLIADEVQQQGTVDHTPVYAREVVKRALEHAASSLILVHNHPSGDPTPSPADIDLTRRLVEAARHLGISVHDHIIIGRRSYKSFKALGLL